MNKIATLLTLQKDIRNARSVRDLGFIIANKTAALVPAKHLVFWTYKNGSVHLHSVSGNATLDSDAPYAQNIKKNILQNTGNMISGQLLAVQTDNKGSAPMDEGAQHRYIIPYMIDENGLFIDLGHHAPTDISSAQEQQTQKHLLIGGIFIEHDTPLQDSDKELLSEISASYGLCLAHLILSAQKTNFLSGGRASKYKIFFTLLIIAAFFCPVRLSITAPAEIIAEKPSIVAAPFDGTLDGIAVAPGQKITKGMAIATMDKTELQARYDSAMQDLKIAQAAYARTGLESLRSDEKKADLRRLQAEINAKKTTLKHAEIYLNRADIIAESEGIAIFSDKSALQDKPFKTGEKILTIADPASIALLIRVPAQSLLPIQSDAQISYHLHPEPLKTRDAKINMIGYEPSVDADGLLTYKIRAHIEGAEDMRIGWKGTAVIPSDWSILGYSILRRPLIALRDMLGL